MNIETLLKKIIEANLDSPVYRVKRFLDSKEKKFLYVFLSTRTRDEITLEATQRFYSVYRSIWEIDDVDRVARLIQPVAFYRVKAKNLYRISREYDHIPESLEELLEMPGVGIKIAKVFLAEIGKEYIGVDTHVHRISNRLGLVITKTPEQTDRELERIVPNSLKPEFNKHLVALGQSICKARSPKCKICPVNSMCKYFLKTS
ncbi:MAG: endonuclease III [Candidatus Anstonellales archaeon]